MNISFNDRLRQLLLLALIIILIYIFITQLYVFLPGFLGGITLYILTRTFYFELVYKKKWKKSLTAILFIVVSLIIILLPVYFAVNLVSPKIQVIMNDPNKILNNLRIFSEKIEDYIGIKILTEENAKSISSRISSMIPKFLNSTLTVLTNLVIMFFLLYYLLVQGKEVERYLNRAIPLKPSNIDKLAKETRIMIRANAFGIPVICFIQGSFAALGYWIFGVNDWGMWGFITGVFAFFPFIGTMVVWVPLVISMYSTGNTWMATWLMVYSFLVTGNVDYIARLILLRKMGDVHPLITLIGVIAGLGLFGFMGLIFGPLLVSYLIILVKIYYNEFTSVKDMET
jgi:predicted PurR-regulated permease PerM